MRSKNCKVVSTIIPGDDVSKELAVKLQLMVRAMTRSHRKVCLIYVVPHPLPTISADDPFESVAPTAEPIPDDNVELEDDYNILMNAPQEPEELEVDLEDDRDYSHNLVGCKIRALR